MSLQRQLPYVTTTAADATEGPVIREADRADLLAVFQIEQTAFPQPWPYTAFEQFVGEPGFLVAEHRGDGTTGHDHVDTAGIVGYVVADMVPNHGQPLGHVKDLAVHPDFRQQGVGRRLLARALAVLETAGVGSVKLEVRESNEPAIALYRKMGFSHRRTVPRYYDNGEDALVLHR